MARGSAVASWVARGLTGYRDARTKLFSLLIAPCFHSRGPKASIAPPLRFANLSLVQLGERVTIHSDCWIHVVAAEMADGAPKIILRDRVCIGMGATISAVRRIELGENVFTARNVYISDHGHEFRGVDVPIADQGIGGIAEVSIGADTWIGQNAVILPGSRIGCHCVIGANTVVRGHVPDFCVAVGAPARVVRRFNPALNEWERVP